MAGLINTPAEEVQNPPPDAEPEAMAPAAPVESGNLVSQITTKIEAKVPRAQKQNFDAMVVSCSKITWEGKGYDLVQRYVSELDEEDDAPMFAAQYVTWVTGLVFAQSGKKGKQLGELCAPAISAGQLLGLHLLEYAAKHRDFEVTNELIDDTMERVTKGLMASFGITQNMVKDLLEKAKTHQGGGATTPPEPPAGAPGEPTGEEAPVDLPVVPAEG